MRLSDRAWITLGLGIGVYELFCPKGELLSEAVDRYLERYPMLTYSVVFVIGAHLLNRIPPRVDPLSILATIVGK